MRPWMLVCTLMRWDLLGHSSIAITSDIYAHAGGAATRSAVDGLPCTLGL
jgi:hypothetical protein